MTSQALQQIQEELYISYSQIFIYLNCSLKYQFQYVEQRPAERISSALPFGKATHTVLETYYREVKETGAVPRLERLLTLFEEGVALQVENIKIPVIFKKEAPDLSSLIKMGKQLVQTFYENVDLTGYEIVDIELPLSAPLFSEDKEPLDIKLFGVIDLLLRDSSGNILVIDNKTSKQKKSQSAVDEDLQLTAYSYLLAANGYTFAKANVNCRLDVLRKLKTPTIEYYTTARSVLDRRRFAKLASQVLKGIENRVFCPSSGWLCSDCQFKDACKDW
ncbi:RecB family exonuclease [Desulfopila inferna]|uniref:RecB family exonuclease n=1 Tax=Desulfopila inferna TaxID=468528 RepID=UPI0019663BB0|nr:PD-(D/E)XK nuclease family protein [Desulfopila inferna]MBM9606740.1 PD-(D/E)XK nuclease family protein [Desulfopila inferna]